MYAANGTTVTEYSRDGSPICTYSVDLTYAVNGTTDAAGNVYMADNGGYIDTFAQCGQTVLRRYAVSAPSGVAVNRRGDIFVLYLPVSISSYGALEEFEKGRNHATQLGAAAVAGGNAAGGLVLDKSNNLISLAMIRAGSISR